MLVAESIYADFRIPPPASFLQAAAFALMFFGLSMLHPAFKPRGLRRPAYSTSWPRISAVELVVQIHIITDDQLANSARLRQRIVAR
jgi:hypothetical protein